MPIGRRHPALCMPAVWLLLALSPSEQAHAKRSSPQWEESDKLPAVQNRLYRNEHEFMLGVGVLPVDAFYQNQPGVSGAAEAHQTAHRSLRANRHRCVSPGHQCRRDFGPFDNGLFAKGPRRHRPFVPHPSEAELGALRVGEEAPQDDFGAVASDEALRGVILEGPPQRDSVLDGWVRSVPEVPRPSVRIRPPVDGFAIGLFQQGRVREPVRCSGIDVLHERTLGWIDHVGRSGDDPRLHVAPPDRNRPERNRFRP